MEDLLVASANDDFDVVVFSRLNPPPQVDSPASSDAPPGNDIAHDVGNSRRVEHLTIVAGIPTVAGAAACCDEQVARRGACADSSDIYGTVPVSQGGSFPFQPRPFD